MGTRSAVAIGIVIGAVAATAVWFGRDRSTPPPTPLLEAPQAARVVQRPAADASSARSSVSTAPAAARPTTPDYGPRTDVSPQIYRCGSRGATVYSNTPCEGARVVDGSSAVSGYDSRPSEKLARLVAQGRVIEAPAPIMGPTMRVRPRSTDEGVDCGVMRRQIADIDLDALQPHSLQRLDELRATRQDIRTRMAREHC